MKVYKFGGASVNSAEAIRNVARIVGDEQSERLIVVVSAMGKMTNALEKVVSGCCDEEQRVQRLASIRNYHAAIVEELFRSDGLMFAEVMSSLDGYMALLNKESAKTAGDYNADYDRVVAYGELISTTIVSHYLRSVGITNRWVDIRRFIKTDSKHRDAHIDWDATSRAIGGEPEEWQGVVVTQGFVAGGSDGETTTLGREGSDFSAAILAYLFDVESVTIWKDVPGFLNADPKHFANTVKIDRLPYNEAIELSYYGASVIHPKTVKPLQNKSIPLYIKSFISPSAEGSTIGDFEKIDPIVPLYIVRPRQVLLSITPKDFSFIAEDNLQVLFGIFATVGVRINLMQNSALSFSVCIDHNGQLLPRLRELLQSSFNVRYNEGLQLITIRYYTQEVIDRIVASRSVILEQRSRTTEQIVVAE